MLGGGNRPRPRRHPAAAEPVASSERRRPARAAPRPPLPPPQAASELGDDVQLHSLMSRIALLVLHFPRLRLIWSRSLHATADLFHQLKANQEEPDAVAGGWVGGGAEGQRAGEGREVGGGGAGRGQGRPGGATPGGGRGRRGGVGCARRSFLCGLCQPSPPPRTTLHTTPAAATVGVPVEAEAAAAAAGGETLVNQAAIDLLRRLPGGLGWAGLGWGSGCRRPRVSCTRPPA